MLSNDTLATPRARPPAQARRSLSMQVTPSPLPQYATTSALKPRMVSLEALAASPIGTPSREDASQLSFDVEQPLWWKERSREELADLLTKAKNTIRESENQLTITSALCRSLYEDGVSLKTKHRAFIAGIPGSSATGTVDFPPAAPHLHTSQTHDTSLARSTVNSFIDTPSTTPKSHLNTRRLRKISVSPSDIALLSDQNAELLQKLEKLEGESRQADQEGRRALKRLEKEIQGLREELEATQARSEELEELAKQGFDKGLENMIEEVLKRKQDKVAKIKALRGKSGDSGSGEDGECEIKDFAPPRIAGLPWSQKQRPCVEISDTAATETSTVDFPHLPGCGTDNEMSPLFDLPKSPDGNVQQTTPPHESAIISQLLSKIKELELMNDQIKQQQLETTMKLRSAKKDAENIGTLYECLGDPANVEWEVVNDASDEDKPVLNVHTDGTIKFRSLRRSLDEASKSAMNANDGGNAFGSGLAANHYSTAHGNFQLKMGSYKQRKSVVGLFDLETKSGAHNDLLARASSYPVEHCDVNGVQRSWSANVTSPALSVLSLATTPLHTLRSELGSDFGEDWGINAGNHHLRTTSLGDMIDMNLGQRSPSPMSAGEPSLQTQEHSGSSTIMQLSPKAPAECLETDFADASRYRRMSQTIHSRTSREVDGRRYKEIAPGSGNHSLGVSDDEANSSEVLESTQTTSDTVTTSNPQGPIGAKFHGIITPVHVRESGINSGGNSSRGERKAIVKLALGVWLWLQFAVIILVFVWTMVKRGPKSVLKDAEQRRQARLRS